MSVKVLHSWSKQVLLPPHLSSSRQRYHVSNGGGHGGGVRGPLVCRFPVKLDRPILLQRSRSCESTLSTSKFIRRRRTSTARFFSFSGEESPENVDDNHHHDHDAHNATESFTGEESPENVDDGGHDDHNSNATEYISDEEIAGDIDDDHHSNATESFSDEEFAEKIDNDHHDSSNAAESFSGEEFSEKLNTNHSRILTEDDYVEIIDNDHHHNDHRLLLANYAQFLYQFVGDYERNRAEECFEMAVEVEEEEEMLYRDAEVYRKYGEFLWKVKKDLEAADNSLFQAFRLQPNNTFFARFYAHFLWLTSSK